MSNWQLSHGSLLKFSNGYANDYDENVVLDYRRQNYKVL